MNTTRAIEAFKRDNSLSDSNSLILKNLSDEPFLVYTLDNWVEPSYDSYTKEDDFTFTFPFFLPKNDFLFLKDQVSKLL